MNKKIVRNKLKNWASATIKEILKYNKHSFYEYKSLVILMFASVLLERVKSNNIYNVSVNKFTKTESWKFTYNAFNKVFSDINIDISNIDKKFVLDTLTFAQEYVNDNYYDIDNILAWLYQYFNLSRDDNEYKDTQFFTDLYMVNYLVRESLSQFSRDELIKTRIIDPACGGGNFIVAVIEELYKKLQVPSTEFLRIVKENVYAYDIDSTLSFICYLNIIVKLMELGVVKSLDANIGSFKVYFDKHNKYGSLLKDSRENELINVTTNRSSKYKNIFKKCFGLVITNPPFKGRRELDWEIREYIKSLYPECKGDLCNSFILRSFDLLNNNGVGAFVAQNGWMFLDSYSDMRKLMINKTEIHSIIDLGSDSFLDLSGEKTSVSLVLYKTNKKNSNVTIYGLKDFRYNKKVEILDNYKLDDYKHVLKHCRINSNSSCRLDYLNKGNLNKAFELFKPYSKFAKPMQGTSTGDNKKYVSYHWETTSKAWKLASKGGGYCKWSGLNMYVVHWGENGEIIKNNPKSVIRNAQYFDDTELVYSDTGTSGLSVRLLREDQIFIASGPGIMIKYGDKYNHLAFLNSRIASYFIKTLTPKLTISAKYIGQLPVPKAILECEKIKQLSLECVNYKESFNKKRPINYEFEHRDYFKFNSLYQYAKEDFLDDLDIELERLKREYDINKLIEKEYNFHDELEIIYSTVGFPPYSIDINKKIIPHNELDNAISKLIDNNCVVKATRVSKTTLGIEGILEYYAVKEGYSPKILKAYIEQNIWEYRKTIMKYYKHLLHRIELMKVGYHADNNFLINNSISYVIEDIKKFNLNINLDEWKNQGLKKWHFASFLKKPLKIIWSD